MQRSPVDPSAVAGSALAPEPPTVAPTSVSVDVSGAVVPYVAPPKEKKKKPNNGWTQSLEILVAEWADKANCYRWMHDKSAGKYHTSNLWLTFPVILLSTITGTASFGINGLLPDNGAYAKYAGAAIGVVSLMTALIQTISNTLRYAQQSEAHRVAGIAWGKFQRFISIELSLHPDERMDAINFLKMARIELDRLIEQSPTIPDSTIREFEVEFRKKTEIKRPEIAGGVEHTRVFTDRDGRLVRLATDAAMMLNFKKKFMAEMVLAEVDKRIAQKTREAREELETTLRAERPVNSVVLTVKEDGPVPASIDLDIPPPLTNENGEEVQRNGEQRAESEQRAE
jgi:hypothetical protein